MRRGAVRRRGGSGAGQGAAGYRPVRLGRRAVQTGAHANVAEGTQGMTPYHLRRVTCSAAATALVMLSASVSAQEITGRVTLEAVASVSVTSDTADDPFLIFDAV